MKDGIWPSGVFLCSRNGNAANTTTYSKMYILPLSILRRFLPTRCTAETIIIDGCCLFTANEVIHSASFLSSSQINDGPVSVGNDQLVDESEAFRCGDSMMSGSFVRETCQLLSRCGLGGLADYPSLPFSAPRPKSIPHVHKCTSALHHFDACHCGALPLP